MLYAFQAIVMSFVWLVFIHLQFVVTWIFLLISVFLLWAGTAHSVLLVQMLMVAAALYFLWCWLVVAVTYKLAMCKVWFRWQA